MPSEKRANRVSVVKFFIFLDILGICCPKTLEFHEIPLEKIVPLINVAIMSKPFASNFYTFSYSCCRIFHFYENALFFFSKEVKN